MKVHLFYLIKKSGRTLYAVTPDKDNAVEFKTTRNMDLFEEEIIEMSKDEFHDRFNNNQGEILRRHNLTTKKVAKNGRYEASTAEVLMTDNESMLSEGDDQHISIMEPDWWLNTYPPTIYKKSIREALSLLEYTNTYKLLAHWYDQNPDYVEKDYGAPDLWVDELAVFISMFQPLFR